MPGFQTQAADQQFFIDDPIIQRHGVFPQKSGRSSRFSQIFRSVGRFRKLPAVTVDLGLALISNAWLFIFQVINVISHMQDQLIGHQSLCHQIQSQLVRHLL